ncbi:ABC transporter [Altererythrobacter sp. B11]|nr:ABC transporter [Altererythrobacter sp. B11]
MGWMARLPAKSAVALAGALALAGCVSFGGGDPPDELITLTPTTTAPAGAAVTGDFSTAISVLEPEAPQSLKVTRVPVQVTPATLAYLPDATWVDRPAKLFGHLLTEAVRMQTGRLVLEGGDLQYAAATQLTGQLATMGYDATSSSVVVRFDAVLRRPDGQVRSRRFESTVPGVAPKAAPVGAALNQAANDVATQVAAWVGR